MKTVETQFVTIAGNLNTRVNPLNRHSEKGFEIRMQKKRNREVRFVRADGRPSFFQEA